MFSLPSATMTLMKKLLVLLLVLLPVTAGGQSPAVNSDDSYEFSLAKLAAEDGRFDEALAKIDKLVAKSPDNVTLQYERAMILVDAARIDDAEAALRKVGTAKPDFYDAQRMLGRIIIERAGSDRAKIDEALTHLQAAFKIYPDDLATGMAVAQILQNMQRWPEAEKTLATLLGRALEQRAINYMYAMVLTKLGRGNESKQYLERAVEVDPTFVGAALQLADIYEAENDFAKAAAVLQPLIADEPTNIEFQRRQAYLYLRGGEPEKARASLKALVDADPKDTRSLFYLADSYNDPDVLASYGLSQLGKHKYDESAKTFQAMQKLADRPGNLQVLAKTQLAYIE